MFQYKMFRKGFKMKAKQMECIHNARARSTEGFFCEDCNTFFGNDSPTYRSGELLSSIWMVLHNINVSFYRAGEKTSEEIVNMKNKIGIGVAHENYEELISEAEILMSKYNKTAKSATMVLG